VTVFEAILQGKELLAGQPLAAKQAFLAYYDEYFPKVYNYIRFRCSDTGVTDDLTAAVFEKALAKLKSFSPERGSFGAWLFAIARNEVNAHLRSLGRHPCLPIDAFHEHPSDSPSPEQRLIAIETSKELLSALEKLSERERDLLGLKFGARLTNRQISAMTSLSESNVGVILYRAISNLRDQLLTLG
jgi:RNA polymerase sigma-70 factor (ECF subfamily)